MELKEFISDVLTQIVEGAEQAQSNVEKYGATINPGGFHQVKGVEYYGRYAEPDNAPVSLCDISFEVSVSSDTSSESGAGISILFGAVNVGGKGGENSAEGMANVIKFTIPVALTAHKANPHVSSEK